MTFSAKSYPELFSFEFTEQNALNSNLCDYTSCGTITYIDPDSDKDLGLVALVSGLGLGSMFFMKPIGTSAHIPLMKCHFKPYGMFISYGWFQRITNNYRGYMYWVKIQYNLILFCKQMLMCSDFIKAWAISKSNVDITRDHNN